MYGKEHEFIVKEDSHTLVPEGVYEVMYASHKISPFMGGGKKLYVRFEICIGPHTGAQIFRAYNFSEGLPRGSDLYKDLELLYGQRLRKNTKLSTNLFKGKVLEVKVRTVRQDRKQGTLPEFRQYSVIERIIGISAGSPGGQK